jgi:ABC-type dipeptide/oligopeptide/nickel transport system ATPase component
VPSIAERVVRRDATIRLEATGPEIGAGCPFQAHCPRKVGRICEETQPPLVAVAGAHVLACHIPPEELVRAQGGPGMIATLRP